MYQLPEISTDYVHESDWEKIPTNKVYVIHGLGSDHETTNLCGVYSTQEKAIEAARRLEAAEKKKSHRENDFFHVYECILDQDAEEEIEIYFIGYTNAYREKRWVMETVEWRAE